jgi:hypothetical protein
MIGELAAGGGVVAHCCLAALVTVLWLYDRHRPKR